MLLINNENTVLMYSKLIINSPERHPMLSSNKNQLTDLHRLTGSYMMTTLDVVQTLIFKNT